jgi:hypothetical protein
MISMLPHIYSGLLDGRLRRVTCLASHKTGFTIVSGCYTNLTNLSDSINGGWGVAPNIMKASDTMPHTSILACLHQQGLHLHTTGLIENMYSGNTVVLPGGVPRAVSRRVRQSDPLSPILFNLVLQSLKVHEGGLPFGLRRQSGSRSQEHYRSLVNSSFLRR